MSLIPSESYSFPDYFSRTVTHSGQPEKEVALVEESEPRRKKRFSFSLRKSIGSRRTAAKNRLELPKEWKEDLPPVEKSVPTVVNETAPVSHQTTSVPKKTKEDFFPVEKSLPPAVNEAVTVPPQSTSPAKKSAPPPDKFPMSLHQGTPEPVPSLFKDDPPPPVRKKVTPVTIKTPPEVPLKNGAVEPEPPPKSVPEVAAPISAPEPLAPSQNGFHETIMSPAGLGQFFQQIAPLEPLPTENNVVELPPVESLSQAEFPESPAESENGTIEVPITPELLAQLFQAMTPAASQVEPESFVAEPFIVSEEDPQFVTPIAPAALEPENFVAEPFIVPEEDPQFVTPIIPAALEPENFVIEPFIVPEEHPQFVAPIAPTVPQPASKFPELLDLPDPPEELQFEVPTAPTEPTVQPVASTMSVEEFFQPMEPLSPQPSNDPVEEFVQPKKLPPQPRRASLPAKTPQNLVPISPPEPQMRRSSVPPSLKRKQRWKKKVLLDQSLPFQENGTAPYNSPFPTAAFSAQPNAPAQEWSPPVPDSIPISKFHPAQPHQPGRQALHPEMPNLPSRNEAVPFETRFESQREYLERVHRSMKMRRFLVLESIMGVLFLLLAILGLTRTFDDPAMVVIVNSLAIAAAAAAVVIPIFFFAITAPAPGEESDIRL